MDKSIVVKNGDTEYILWLSKDLKLCCNKTVNGNFVMGLDSNDRMIISDVIDSLCVSSDSSYFVKSDSINGVSYNLFYDYNKFLYYTDSFDDGVNSFVNLKYNNIPLVYSSNDEKNKFDKAKRFVRQSLRCIVGFGVGVAIGFFAVRLAFKLYNDPELRKILSNYFISEVPTDLGISGELSFNELNIQKSNLVDGKKIDGFNVVNIDNGVEPYNITFSDISVALSNNSNVDSDFKEFFNKLDFAFDDNMEYFDSSILDKIGSLKVEYDFESDIGNYVNGQYYPVDNKIVYYNAKYFNEVDPNTALHEIGHVFQSVYTSNICFELSNEVWTREVLRKMVDDGLISSDLFEKDARGNIVYEDGYTDKLFLYYYLMELMSKDSINKFQWKPNDFDLVSSLADMNNNYEVSLAHEILELVDECRSIGYLTSDNEKVVELKEKLNYFYNKKYGFNLENDINVFAFDYVPTNVNDSLFNELLINNLSGYNLDNVDYYGLAKSYFTDDYDTKLYCGVLRDRLNRDYYEVSIDDNLRSDFSIYNGNGLKK